MTKDELIERRNNIVAAQGRVQDQYAASMNYLAGQLALIDELLAEQEKSN